MLSILCVRLTIKVKVGIPESFKVGWYAPQKTAPSHLKFGQNTCNFYTKAKTLQVQGKDGDDLKNNPLSLSKENGARYISEKHLNRGGLHLTRQDNDLLYGNFVKS